MLLTAQTSRENVSQNKCVWTTLSEFHLVCIQLDGIYVGSVTRAKVDKDVRVRVLELKLCSDRENPVNRYPTPSISFLSPFYLLVLVPSHSHSPFSFWLLPRHMLRPPLLLLLLFFETNIRKNQTNSTKMNGIEKEVRLKEIGTENEEMRTIEWRESKNE